MNLPPPPSTMDAVSFGPFHLIPSARRLEKDGIPVKIGSRAFDILIQLVEQAGTPVGHKTLIERVWRGVVVEESSLRVNITGLRRALGDSSGGSQYVANVPGQGYCFVAPITHSSGAQAGSASVAAPAAYPLPAPLPRMVGRGELVPMLASQLLSQRFVTIVGPGGMGKTTTAIAIAHSLRADFADAVCFFDLGALSSPELLPNTMAATLGLPASANPQHSLAAWLQDKKFLLVFDNCEHLIDAVAMLAEQLHHAAPRLCILATSREALRVEGEYAHRLLPLECPPESVSLSAQEALAFPAVQLFVERARAGGHGFELHDAEVPLVAQICRQLDGIALAIELSAGRVAAFGVRGTAELLGSGSGLSWEGRRTAVPRHQTLNAMLDWSYKLLPECERKVLRRLSAFVGQFSLEGAIHVASDGPQDQSQVIAALGSLVGKSLATVENVASGCCYRLLDSTRMYVAEKLAASGEAQLAARRNAEYLAGYLEQLPAEDTIFPTPHNAPKQLEYLGNLRACLDWCFSAAGDAAIGVRLCAAAMPSLLQASLLEECKRWSAKGIAALDGAGGSQQQEMVLQEAFAISTLFMMGNTESVLAAIERGLDLARALGDRRHQLRLLAGLNMYRTRTYALPEALTVAVESAALARELCDPTAMAMAEWMLGVAYHLVGDQDAALLHCETGLTLVDSVPGARTICFGYDHRIRALAALARALWLKGQHERASAVACQAITEAEKLDHPISYCIALTYATPIFTWNGEWEVTEELIGKLTDHATKHKLLPYLAVAQGLKGGLLVQRGQPRAGIALLRACLETLCSGYHQIRNTVFLLALAKGLVDLDQLDEAQAIIDEVDASGARCYNAPEMARLRELLAARRAMRFTTLHNA